VTLEPKPSISRCGKMQTLMVQQASSRQPRKVDSHPETDDNPLTVGRTVDGCCLRAPAMSPAQSRPGV
jgi:hypothetical protein